jgi:GTP-binding protein LepA
MLDHIRNFCIIAHIDHGKSTLADRFLELTHAVSARELVAQTLDDMDLERERGITIKCHPVRLHHTAADGQTYLLNLIDTPGHVDFSYEVSRSLAACDGAVLLVDATQGVQAQTVANVHLALDHKLLIIPVINKVDAAAADIDGCTQQIVELLHCDPATILRVSAKTGAGVPALLETIIQRVPPPRAPEDSALRWLIFDSEYDVYKGVVVYGRIFSGTIAKGDRIRMMFSGAVFEVIELGVFTPTMKPIERLGPGEVGYLTAIIRDAADVRIGDTITSDSAPAPAPLHGFRQFHPMVFSGFYPIDASQYDEFKKALARLRLNDASFTYEPETSAALGFGFRCGFLGLLHMEIIQERLDREFNIDLIATAPSVIYHVMFKNGEIKDIDNPLNFPDPAEIEEIDEPFVNVLVITPVERIGAVMSLARERRGTMTSTESLDAKRVQLHFEMPLNEIIIDFYDKIKTVTSGYGSLDYEPIGYRPSDLVKLDIMLNGEPVDAFSMIVHRDHAYDRGRVLAERLKNVIPRQQFAVAIQAAIGGRVVARETVSALRKNVLAKCYGGDITRKRKLLEKQKEGKKRMKEIGKVTIPQKAFLDVLRAE